MGDALRLFGGGTVIGGCVAGVIVMSAWLVRNGVKETWLVAGSMVLLGIGILAAALYPQSLRSEAEAKVRQIEITFMGMRVKMPCAGAADLGFVVDYRKPGETIDRQGRVCRAVTGGPWTWHPDTNDMHEHSVLP